MLVFVDRFRSDRGLIPQRPDALTSRVVWNSQRDLRHVVVVVRLGQLMTKALCVRKRARLIRTGDKRRVHCNPDDVIAGRHWQLSGATIADGILPPQLPALSVRPTPAAALADPLVSGNVRPAAAEEIPVHVGGAGIWLILLYVDHAESMLGCAPNKAGAGIDQLVERVVPEMKVIVTSRELIEPVACGDVL